MLHMCVRCSAPIARSVLTILLCLGSWSQVQRRHIDDLFVPMVKFECGITTPILPVSFGVIVQSSEYYYRTQIPLRLCWGTVPPPRIRIHNVCSIHSTMITLACSCYGAQESRHDARQV